MKASLKSAIYAAMPDVSMYRDAARIGLAIGLVARFGVAGAAGFATGFQNLNTLMQLVVGFIILVGLVGGLGMVLGGLISAYKKYDNRNDDVSWGKIATQMGAGGFAMALGWVGTQVVETVGGSSSDIGRSITSR